MKGSGAPSATRMYSVGELARLARVSVRALHHYDAIGLLAPSERTPAGYRVYGRDDLEELQQILLFKELDFPLEDIRRILLDPQFDRRAALVAQRDQLAGKARRRAAILAAIDRALEVLEKGTTMSDDEMFEVFGDFDSTAHRAEAETKWGASDAYRESSRRTTRYGKDEWRTIRAEGDAITAALGERLASGASADDPAVLDLAERHRLQIERWFYPCSYEMHRGLGEMYVNDPRFAATYERVQPGLAGFLRDAIAANAAAHGA